MSKIVNKEVSLANVLNLKVELEGNENIKGFLYEAMNISAKFHLNRLYDRCVIEDKEAEKLRIELVKKYGILLNPEESEEFHQYRVTEIEEKEGRRVINPKYNEYVKDYTDFIENTKVLIDLPIFSIAEFGDLKTESNYKFILSLLVED